MPLIKHNAIVEDPWVVLEDGEPAPQGAPVVVSLERWQAERDGLMDAGVPLGITLRSDQPPRLIADDVEQFALIALDFPKFTDGRPFSYARLLRERYGFAGELRATGHVLRDQALFLARCGFDAIALPAGTPVESWRAALARISVCYQPTGDGRPWAARLRRSRSALGDHLASPQANAPAVPTEEACAAAWAY